MFEDQERNMIDGKEDISEFIDLEDKIEKIEGSMDERKSISAYYGNYYRELSPYVCGIKKEDHQCLYYQYAGETSSGAIEGHSQRNWKCMKTKKLEDIKVLIEPFHHPEIISRKAKSMCVDKVTKRPYWGILP